MKKMDKIPCYLVQLSLLMNKEGEPTTQVHHLYRRLFKTTYYPLRLVLVNDVGVKGEQWARDNLSYDLIFDSNLAGILGIVDDIENLNDDLFVSTVICDDDISGILRFRHPSILVLMTTKD